MTENQLASIERRFGCKLPRGYRQLLVSIPGELLALLKWEDNEYKCEEQTCLYRTQRNLVAMNTLVRDSETDEFEFDPNNRDRPWPDRYFVIGGDVGGNFYCVNTQLNRDRVYFWNHGDTRFVRVCDGVPRFIKHLFREFAEVAVGSLNRA